MQNNMGYCTFCFQMEAQRTFGTVLPLPRERAGVRPAVPAGFPKTKNHEMKDLFRKPRCEKNLAIFNPKIPILIDLSEFYFPKKK